MMTGCNGKLRFTIRFPFNNQMLRFGCHDPKSEDRADVCRMMDAYLMKETDILLFYPKEEYDEKKVRPMVLPDGCEISWGWYDHEHVGFMPISEFIKQEYR